MSIRDDQPNTSSFAAPEAAPAIQQADTGGQKWGFFSGGPVLSRKASNESVTKVVEILVKHYSTAVAVPSWVEVQVLPLDNNKDNAPEGQLTFGGVIIACSVKDSSAKHPTAYHTLILEATAEDLTPYPVNEGGATVNLTRVTGDSYTPVYRQVVANLVAQRFGGRPIVGVGAQVVPRTFNWEDADAVHELALNGLLPGVTELEPGMPWFREMDLTAFNGDASLVTRVNYNKGETTDYVGLPVRSNVGIDLVAVQAGVKTGLDVNQQERSRVISRMGGFIDVNWFPVESAPNWAYNVQNQPQQKYGARLIITEMECEHRLTLPGQLFALIPAFTMTRDDYGWIPYFAPNQNVRPGEIDPRDIGALNIEAKILPEDAGREYGTVIDTKSASFTTQQLGAMVRAMIRPGLAVAIDVSETGADTWYNEVFAEAALGNPKAQAAINEAANKLTGGHLAAVLGDKPIDPVIVNDDRIHLGYYTDHNGLKHDIRDIDYIAIMNKVAAAGNVMDAGKEWSDTFTRTDFGLARRLEARKEMIVSALKTNVVFKGYARRCTLRSAWLDAFLAAVLRSGFTSRLETPNGVFDYNSSRAEASWMNDAMVRGSQNSAFSSGRSFGGGGSTGGSSFGGNFGSGRW